MAARNIKPSAVVQELNAQIARTTNPEKYATFCYAVLSPEKQQLTYTNAGHNYPILLRSNGALIELTESNLIVGVCEDMVYGEHAVAVNAGDTIVFYTDGVTEAQDENRREFDTQRLFEVIARYRHLSAEGLRNRIYEAVLQFIGDMPQSDDLTLVVVRLK